MIGANSRLPNEHSPSQNIGPPTPLRIQFSVLTLASSDFL
jgi:hypothetical protein